MRKDPVTPGVAQAVMLRDAHEIWLDAEAYSRLKVTEQNYWTKRIICVAPVLDPSQSGACWGRTTLEHVKDDLRMGRRAASDPAHLVSLCQGHTEDGRKAGYQWNTDKRNREKVREWLRRFDVEDR